MKRFMLLVASLLFVSGLAFAQETYAEDGMLIHPGTSNANVGIATTYGGTLIAGGGYEFVIGEFDLAEIPLSYGAAVRANVGFISPLYLTVGAMGTLHVCWAAFDALRDAEWANNLDSYLGVGLTMISFGGLNFKFDTIVGFSYFFSESMAVNVEGGILTTTVGVLFKL